MALPSGIKHADFEELKRVASQPSSDFSFFVNDFGILRTLLPLISRRVCTTAGGVPVTLPCESSPFLHVCQLRARSAGSLPCTSDTSPSYLICLITSLPLQLMT